MIRSRACGSALKSPGQSVRMWGHIKFVPDLDYLADNQTVIMLSRMKILSQEESGGAAGPVPKREFGEEVNDVFKPCGTEREPRLGNFSASKPWRAWLRAVPEVL